jgi:twitching motility protein PilT
MDYAQELQSIIDALVSQGGSDIHITAQRKPVLRVSGDLVSLETKQVYTQQDVEQILIAMVGQEKFDYFAKNKELDFAYDYKEGYRLRGNAYVQQEKLGIALRLIPKIKSLEELNLPEAIRQFAYKEQGFFLVVGPVGQGKSTTMASLLEIINQERAEHVVTIEDPIEYQFEPKRSLIEQREVGIDTESFATALKSVFRQDANVIMIGEMRGPETMAAAVTAAETGHLVFSTLHTNNAAQTIDRIIDSFPAEQQQQIRSQLANTLLGVFSQRLIPRVTGGLVPAYELLINNNAVANLIREKRTHEIGIAIETGTQHGMIDMNHSLAELVKRGEISIESARTHSLNPRILDRLV